LEVNLLLGLLLDALDLLHKVGPVFELRPLVIGPRKWHANIYSFDDAGEFTSAAAGATAADGLLDFFFGTGRSARQPSLNRGFSLSEFLCTLLSCLAHSTRSAVTRPKILNEPTDFIAHATNGFIAPCADVIGEVLFQLIKRKRFEELAKARWTGTFSILALFSHISGLRSR